MVATKTTTKRLQDYLLDPQEPFNLQVHLAERGNWFSSLRFDAANACCLMISSKNSKTPHRVRPASKKVFEFAKKITSVLQKTVTLGDQTIPNLKNSYFDDSVSSESFSGEYPPSDYDHGSFVVESCQTDAEKTASDLQRAWRLWENSIVNCKRGKAENVGMKRTGIDTVLSNRNRFLMTNRRKMQSWLGTKEPARLQRIIRSKLFLSWRVELKGGVNSERQRVSVSEDWNVCPEERTEIGRVMEDVIMDEIVQEMILLFSHA